ncbi:MAG: hypothetical protein WC508_01880 [Patescibacteria group bacterium]
MDLRGKGLVDWQKGKKSFLTHFKSDILPVLVFEFSPTVGLDVASQELFLLVPGYETQLALISRV